MKTGSAEEKKRMHAIQQEEDLRLHPEAATDISYASTSLEQLVGLETIISGELIGNLLPLSPGTDPQEDHGALNRKKKRKKRPPEQNR
jgi:hypothetical protein